ncbi:MAG: hypothetical protein LUF68_03245, partial [Clostridiales bacterium]|nr:hypothetical protein [Clostridiales bacterium]
PRAAALITQLMAVESPDQAVACCRQLRQRQTLYGVYLPYRQAEAAQVVCDSVLQDVSALHPGVTIFLPLESDEGETGVSDYQFVLTARNEQKFRTLPFEMWGDIRRIDGIISDEAVVAVFDGEGRLLRKETGQPCRNLSIREMPLAEILAAAFPRRQSREETD